MVTERLTDTPRRDVLTAIAAGALVFLSPRAAPAAAPRHNVHGRVINRCSGNEGAAAGIAGVMVSNGRDVAVTDASGRWHLTARTGDTIFVIKPAHWSYEQDSGVPNFSAAVAQPRPEVPIDFYLRPTPEPSAFEVLLLADTQAANAKELGYVCDELRRNLASRTAAFAISHGDVMGDDLSLLAPYREFLASTGMVWHHCPGNHDMDLEAPSSDLAFETWKRIIGPAQYAFQYSGATFILLNNVEYFGRGAPAHQGRLYRGCIGPTQLQFVANVLRNVPKDQLVVLSMHIPLKSFEDPHCAADNTADRGKLMELLAGRPHTVSFSGHSHTTEHHYLGREDGFTGAQPHHHHVLTAFCGSWWGGPPDANGVPRADSRDGSPRGFHVLSVDGSRYTTRFVASVDDDPSHMRLRQADGQVETGPLPARNVLVNLFDGGPKSRITLDVLETGAQITLVRTAMRDPEIVESYARHRGLLKPWVEAAPSSHVWLAPLPALQGAPGERRCIMRVSNEYGQERLYDVLV